MPVLPSPHNNLKALNLSLKFLLKSSCYFLFGLSKQQEGIIKLHSIAVTKSYLQQNIYHKPICTQN